MTESKNSRDRITKWLRWTARILSLPIIVYALLILIGYMVNWITTGTADPQAVPDYPFIENLPPIFMLLAIIGLGIAWFKEKLGGIINLIFCLATLPILIIHWPIIDTRNAIPYILILIIVTPGILFLVYWWRSKIHSAGTQNQQLQ